MLGGLEPLQLVTGVHVQVLEEGHDARPMLGVEGPSHRIWSATPAVTGVQRHRRGLEAIAGRAQFLGLRQQACPVQHVDEWLDDVVGLGR